MISSEFTLVPLGFLIDQHLNRLRLVDRVAVTLNTDRTSEATGSLEAIYSGDNV